MRSLFSRPIPRAPRFYAMLAAALFVLSGCGNLVTPPEPVAFHDLGVDTDPAPTLAGAPATILVSTPPWLHSGAMQYRLNWDQPSRRRAYAQSRWAAEPGEMLSLALRRGLNAGESVGNACRLKIELDEFVQEFETADRSRVDIVLRASWLPPRGETSLASKRFTATTATPSADAEGGVAAFRDAIQDLTKQLRSWIATLDAGSSPGQNSYKNCKI